MAYQAERGRAVNLKVPKMQEMRSVRGIFRLYLVVIDNKSIPLGIGYIAPF